MNLLRFFISVLFIILSIFVSVIGYSVCFMEYIRPENVWIITFSGLFYPACIILNIICIIYWVCRQKFRSLFLFMCIVALCLTVNDIFNFSFNKKPSDKSLKIVTYNIGGFRLADNKAQDKDKNSAIEIADWLQKENPNIVCFQEFSSFPKNSDYYKSFPYYIKSATCGTIIFSTYPIRESGEYTFDKTMNNIFWADILINNQIIKIINVHLQTTSVTVEEQKVKSGIKSFNSNQMYDSFKDATKHMMTNYTMRAKQIDQLKEIIEETETPFIICGDFNDTPYSYTYQTVSKHLSDGFKKCGNGYGYTYHRFFHTLRIDYILYTHDWEGFSYHSPELPYSDHNPVVMEIGLKENREE